MEVDARPAVSHASSLAVFATDGELLMRFERHRDEQAFAEVIERHGRLVWIVCQQTLVHHQDVEDAFQATFLILARKATTIRASDSAAAWLYRVAQRTAVAARRQRARRREEPLTVEPPQGDDALPVIHDRQMLHVLMEELRALPQRYQTPLMLRYFEGQSRRSIAEQTDSTLAQVQGRLVRGRRMLRSRLIRRGVSLSLAAGAVATASTAASSTVFIASGTAGAASPASLELAKQGVQGMWYASLAKSTGVAAALLIGLGVAWGAGQAGSGDGGPAAVQVDLGESAALAAADNGNEEAAAIEIAVSGDETPQPNRDKKEASWVVSDVDPARRQFELERDHWLLKAKAYRLKAKRLSALAAGGQASPDSAVDAMLMEADANLAEAKSIELGRQLVNADPATDAVQELEQTKAESEAEITELETILEKIRPSVATEAARVEFQQLERAWLQRELEQLHAVLMQLNQADAVAPDGEQDDQSQQNRQRQKDVISAKITTSLEKLTAKLKEIAEASAKLEGAKRKQLALERQLEHLEQQKLQLALPQVGLELDVPLQQRRLQATVAHLELMRDRLERENAELKSQLRDGVESGTSALPPGDVDITIAPGDWLRIEARGVRPDEPIFQEYPVEAMGTVALGPEFGRVKVAGLSILDAEEAVRKHLMEKFENATVQLTMSHRPKPAAQDQGLELRHMKASMAVLEGQLASMSEQLAALRSENVKLKKQSSTTSSATQAGDRYAPAEGTPPANNGFSSGYREGEGDGGGNSRESQLNLRRLGRSFLAYHNAHNRFPSNKHAPGGEPLLSWRVHLLPFLGYDELYRKFKFDEPWDGPHNKTLISEMPDVFVGSDLSESRKTAYLAPIGRGYLFDVSRRPAALRDIIDGSAYTISMIEVKPEKAVIWTKPDDLAIDAQDPLSGLGESRLALFVDGNVEVISNDIDPATFNALLTRGGREQLDRKAIFGKDRTE